MQRPSGHGATPMVDEGLRRAGLTEASRPDLPRRSDNLALIIERWRARMH
jgi:hypothetical protein